jgi:hypothetical protein
VGGEIALGDRYGAAAAVATKFNPSGRGRPPPQLPGEKATEAKGREAEGNSDGERRDPSRCCQQR